MTKPCLLGSKLRKKALEEATETLSPKAEVQPGLDKAEKEIGICNSATDVN